MIGLALGLGFRGAFARAARGRLLTSVAIGAVAAGCLLAALAVARVHARELQRYETLSSLALPADGHGPTSNQSDYRGRTIVFVMVPDGYRAPAVAWLGDLPTVGEVRFSPALAARVDEDPLLRAWFPYRRGPDLPAEAMGTAGQYTAYIGVDPSGSAEAFVGPGRIDGFSAPGSVHYAALGALLFVVAPGLGLLALVGRFGRRLRRERFGALRLLGVPASLCRLTLGVETAVPVLIGAAGLTVAARLLVPRHIVLPIVGRWVLGGDLVLSPADLLLVVAVTGAVGATAGARSGGGRPGTGRLRALVASADSRPIGFAVVYALGLIVSGWTLLAPKPQDPLRLVGVVLVCAGLPSAVVWVAAATARAVGRRPGPVPWFLAMRKLAADPRSFARLAGMVGVILFAAGATQPLAQLVASPEISWVRRAADDDKPTVLAHSESGPAPDLRLDRPPPKGTRIALPVVKLWEPGQPMAVGTSRTALVATCDQLRELFVLPLPTCREGLQELRQPGQPGFGPAIALPGEVRDDAGTVLATLPPPSSVVLLENFEMVAIPSLVVAPSALEPDARPYTVGVYLRVDADADAFVGAQGWVTAASPFHRLVNEYDGYDAGDSVGTWLLLGFTFAAGVALFAALLVGLDEQRSSGEWATLRALGVPGRDLVRTRLWIAAVLSIVTTVLATLPALALALSYVRLVDDPLTSYRPYLIGPAVATGVIVATQLVGATLQLRRLHQAPG